jgi:hypothetical protein
MMYDQVSMMCATKSDPIRPGLRHRDGCVCVRGARLSSVGCAGLHFELLKKNSSLKRELVTRAEDYLAQVFFVPNERNPRNDDTIILNIEIRRC